MNTSIPLAIEVNPVLGFKRILPSLSLCGKNSNKSLVPIVALSKALNSKGALIAARSGLLSFKSLSFSSVFERIPKVFIISGIKPPNFFEPSGGRDIKKLRFSFIPVSTLI